MADQLLFNRDTKLFIGRSDADGTNTIYFEVPILSDFSFSQSTNTTEITLNEAESGGVSRRTKQMYNDSFAPAEWSFTTYMRPFLSTGGATRATTNGANGYITDTSAYHHAVEEVLWDAFVNKNDENAGVTSDATDMDVLFSGSNTSTLGTMDLYFVMDSDNAGSELVYQITDAVINTASIDFDINDLAKITWSGFGSLIQDNGTTLPYTSPGDLITEAVDLTTNYIRNKLTTLTLQASAPGTDTYALVLTGGNITFSNNISYLTPDTIGSVNQPFGHIAGTRDISGNFTVYLDNEGTAGTELYDDLQSATSTVTTNFDLTFTIGGASAPKVAIFMDKAHLELPTLVTDDLVSLDVAFHGLPSDTDAADEVTVKYFGV